MNKLQAFKQQGRLLRAHLAQVFQREVTLSQAYEALAASEGTTWNELSARLASTKPETTLARLVAPGPLKVRALFTTGDDSAAAEFDAEPWLVWAGKERIAQLLRQLRLEPAEGFLRAYGGNNALAQGIALLCSGAETGALHTAVLTQVFRYIGAKDELGHDYGGSYCFVDQADLLRWLKAQPFGHELLVDVLSAVVTDLLPVAAPREGLLDTMLDTPEQTDKMLEVCQSAWEHAKGHWAAVRARGERCEYLIERGDVLHALADCDVVPSAGTEDEPEYDIAAVKRVERCLETLGYELHARRLFEEVISPDEPMLGISTFSQMAVGSWFRNTFSCTLYRKESDGTVRPYKEIDAAPFAGPFGMAEEMFVRVIRR